MKYAVTFDRFNSSVDVTEDEKGFTFDEACDQLIDYAESSRYWTQRNLWKNYKAAGEQAFQDSYFAPEQEEVEEAA